jgi:hypothetical protein
VRSHPSGSFTSAVIVAQSEFSMNHGLTGIYRGPEVGLSEVSLDSLVWVENQVVGNSFVTGS